MDNKFRGVIWTNHAIERLKERGISQGDAWATWKNPEQSRFADSQGAWVYYRTYHAASAGKSGNTRIEVVAKKNEKGEWLILSVWSKPVYGATKKPDSLFSLIMRRIIRSILKKIFGLKKNS